MDFVELARLRRSVRAYRSTSIPPELLERVLEAVRLAPTACNRQPFRVLVLETAGHEAELGRIYHRAWFVEAPLVIGVVAITAEAWVRRDGLSYRMVDAAIVMDHLILAATSLGLGTCWVAAFDPCAAAEVLGLPPGVEPVAFTPLGYAADEPAPKERRPVAELVRRQHW